MDNNQNQINMSASTPNLQLSDINDQTCSPPMTAMSNTGGSERDMIGDTVRPTTTALTRRRHENEKLHEDEDHDAEEDVEQSIMNKELSR